MKNMWQEINVFFSQVLCNREKKINKRGKKIEKENMVNV